MHSKHFIQIATDPITGSYVIISTTKNEQWHIKATAALSHIDYTSVNIQIHIRVHMYMANQYPHPMYTLNGKGPGIRSLSLKLILAVEFLHMLH